MKQIRLMILFVMIAMFTGVMAQPAFAQKVSQNDLLQATNFTEEYTEEIRKLVKKEIDGFDKASTASQLNRVRANIMSLPNFPNATNAFKTAWSSEVLNQLSIKMLNPRTKTVMKMNVLMLSSDLYSNLGSALIKSGLEDADPSIRYWAAKSITDMVRKKSQGADKLTNNDKNTILVDLEKAMLKEAESIALEEMYVAAGRINTQAAHKVIVKVLQKRLPTYVNGIHSGIRAERRGINRLYFAMRSGLNASKPVLKDFAIIAGKYVQVVRIALAKEAIDPMLYASSMEVMTDTEQVFLFALQTFDAPAFAKVVEDVNATPPVIVPAMSVAAAVDEGDVVKITQRASLWFKTVIESKIGIKEADFTLPEAAAANN